MKYNLKNKCVQSKGLNPIQQITSSTMYTIRCKYSKIVSMHIMEMENWKTMQFNMMHKNT